MATTVAHAGVRMGQIQGKRPSRGPLALPSRGFLALPPLRCDVTGGSPWPGFFCCDWPLCLCASGFSSPCLCFVCFLCDAVVSVLRLGESLCGEPVDLTGVSNQSRRRAALCRVIRGAIPSPFPPLTMTLVVVGLGAAKWAGAVVGARVDGLGAAALGGALAADLVAVSHGLAHQPRSAPALPLSLCLAVHSLVEAAFGLDQRGEQAEGHGNEEERAPHRNATFQWRRGEGRRWKQVEKRERDVLVIWDPSLAWVCFGHFFTFHYYY